MALRYPEVRVGGTFESGLIITAGLPAHLCPQQNRDQALILTPEQAVDLVRQIDVLRFAAQPVAAD